MRLLTDEQLNELGVTRLGDRATLRKKCREVEESKPFLIYGPYSDLTLFTKQLAL